MPASGSFDETTLLKRLREHDKEAFDEIYRHYHARLRNFVLAYVKSIHRTEDIVQDVFMKIWEQRENIDLNKNFSAYIFTITRHLVFKFLKEAARHPHLVEEIIISMEYSANNGQQTTEWKELQAQVRQAIELLPAKRREVFLLCREKEMSYDEISKVMHISRNTIKEHMVLAMRAIREFLQQNAGSALLWMTLALPWLEKKF